MGDHDAGDAQRLVDSDGQRATQMQERVVKIIRKATELRASDVHFVVSPAGTGSKIRFRVDGLLKTVEQFRSQELHELCRTRWMQAVQLSWTNRARRPLLCNAGLMFGALDGLAALFSVRRITPSPG